MVVVRVVVAVAVVVTVKSDDSGSIRCDNRPVAQSVGLLCAFLEAGNLILTSIRNLVVSPMNEGAEICLNLVSI